VAVVWGLDGGDARSMSCGYRRRYERRWNLVVVLRVVCFFLSARQDEF